jgi:hypothetical protein
MDVPTRKWWVYMIGGAFSVSATPTLNFYLQPPADKKIKGTAFLHPEIWLVGDPRNEVMCSEHLAKLLRVLQKPGVVFLSKELGVCEAPLNKREIWRVHRPPKTAVVVLRKQGVDV